MHPVARVSINKHRNLRTQQMLVHSFLLDQPQHYKYSVLHTNADLTVRECQCNI
jgi:hypothetical protein